VIYLNIMIYKCRLCNYSGQSNTAFVEHVQIHRNTANFVFHCGISECSRTFGKLEAFKSHVYRDHNKLKKLERSKPLQHSDINISCQVRFCEFNCNGFAEFISHIKDHIEKGEEIECPFKSCSSTFKVKSSFSSHLSRKHKSCTVENLDVSVYDSQVISSTIGHQNDQSYEDMGFDGSVDTIDEEVNEGNAIKQTVDENNFINNLALFYLKMQAKMLLPATTIQTLIGEFQQIHDIGQSHMRSVLHDKLSNAGIDDHEIDKIIYDLSKEDLMKTYNNGLLRSDATRKTFFKTQFNYVEPVPVYLGEDAAGQDRFCQYIPVLETIKSLFKQTCIQKQQNCQRASPENILEDVIDGKIYRHNRLFQENPDALSLILYQDAFEVANPLGSGKKKHKILAVYVTLGNILPHNRSTIDQIQLVLLCREKDFKYFGHDKVFAPLLTDLRALETSGVFINENTNLKGTLLAIAGDNLGSHNIGGFMENFSKSTYFCRYCIIDRNSFLIDPTKTGEKRTVDNYQRVTADLENGLADNSYGIKFGSIFNTLEHFHVCKPGLPPCLGHDLFEGVVAFDLAMFIKHLVNVEKKFTYTQLNRIISDFRYQGSDANNKPCELNSDSDKLSGHAVQNWCFLRLLPILISDRIKDPFDNDVWQMCLKLREIVELVCAPKIHVNQVAYMKVLIEDYLDLRSDLFPGHPLKPKHHYLLHYPDLTIQFGPLIRVWTLRFESKHTYFKQCVRKLHNFKNMCSTQAERHQLLQAYLGAGEMFAQDLQVENGTEFYADTYNPKVQSAVNNFSFGAENTLVAHNVSYKGTAYKKGMLLVVDQNKTGYVFGKIVLILVHLNTSVYFVVEKNQSVYCSDVGLHCLNNHSNFDTVCINAADLLDYYPLPEYRYCGMQVTSLHHSMCLAGTENV
jgi:hypothetical protein